MLVHIHVDKYITEEFSVTKYNFRRRKYLNVKLDNPKLE